MIEVMGSLRITEAELARDVHAVLAKVRTGVEVIVEQDHRPVATIKAAARSGRPSQASTASAKASGSKVTLDEGTANLRERLKAGALANAKLNLELAEEWFPVEQEAWQRLEREEQAGAKATRGAVKSTSRRSTRRLATK
jgi:antitoxin (DNA-binding transcriptional repressor) of toxin-antitoxin stability system